ncbi:hypothetical protein WAI453_004898 [Rhynchosporium graminicola]
MTGVLSNLQWSDQRLFYVSNGAGLACHDDLSTLFGTARFDSLEELRLCAIATTTDTICETLKRHHKKLKRVYLIGVIILDNKEDWIGEMQHLCRESMNLDELVIKYYWLGRSAPPPKEPLSWQRLVELLESDFRKESPHRLDSTPFRRLISPPDEFHRVTQDPDVSSNEFATRKPHIDHKTRQPNLRLLFEDQKATLMLLGKDEKSLEEIGLFFPAVVFQFERTLNSTCHISKGQNKILTFWLEVKWGSDPQNDGLKKQINAYRRGFEA